MSERALTSGVKDASQKAGKGRFMYLSIREVLKPAFFVSRVQPSPLTPLPEGEGEDEGRTLRNEIRK
jgi:hypothetical protein